LAINGSQELYLLAAVVLLSQLNSITPYLIASHKTMTYGNMPLIIPILATGYLLTIYLLLGLAQRNALKDAAQAPKR